jgi:hypothetical protein
MDENMCDDYVRVGSDDSAVDGGGVGSASEHDRKDNKGGFELKNWSVGRLLSAMGIFTCISTS